VDVWPTTKQQKQRRVANYKSFEEQEAEAADGHSKNSSQGGEQVADQFATKQKSRGEWPTIGWLMRKKERLLMSICHKKAVKEGEPASNSATKQQKQRRVANNQSVKEKGGKEERQPMIVFSAKIAGKDFSVQK